MTDRARAALYDTEAALRLVDSTLQDMTGVAPVDPPPAAARSSAPLTVPQDLAGMVGKGYAELVRVLDTLRQTRSALEKSAVERLQQTHDKLRDVSEATEVAATDILNGIERAMGMIDELDTLDGQDPEHRAPAVRATLRDELFAVMGHMQFQDIAAQQLAYASAVLQEMEARLTSVVGTFDPAVAEVPPPTAIRGPFDPEATTQNREQRQAMADAIVAAGGSRS